jgi:hypothetical protein
MKLPHEDSHDLRSREKVWDLLSTYGLCPRNSEIERAAMYTFRAIK